MPSIYTRCNSDSMLQKSHIHISSGINSPSPSQRVGTDPELPEPQEFFHKNLGQSVAKRLRSLTVQNDSTKDQPASIADITEISIRRRNALQKDQVVLRTAQDLNVTSMSKTESSVSDIDPNKTEKDFIKVPIQLEKSEAWVDRNTRDAWKYSPVLIGKNSSPEAIESIKQIRSNRITICRELAMRRELSDNRGWCSFIRGDQLHELQLNQDNVPAIVTSSGSAKKIAVDLEKNYLLAWHPMNMRGEPVYLFVHRLEYESYASALDKVLRKYPNLHLIGWDCGALTGIGAVRSSAIAFADTLSYQPKRVLMIDHDVVQTENTRHTNPAVERKVEGAHQEIGELVGYGVGYPTRQDDLIPKPFGDTPNPYEEKYASWPVQQFVSIQAPFREKGGDGIYPAYMVGGAEDKLLTEQLGLIKNKRNIAVLNGRIVKKTLKGEKDEQNLYSAARAKTLQAIFEAEKDTPVEFENQKMTLDGLMTLFAKNKWIDSHPSVESYNAAVCIIERIILKFYK